jgi:hypothetical protein
MRIEPRLALQLVHESALCLKSQRMDLSNGSFVQRL